MPIFQAADLLVPHKALLPDWAVIACDQFPSQPDYWRDVRERVGAKPSAYHITFPEAELGGDEEGRIASDIPLADGCAWSVVRGEPGARNTLDAPETIRAEHGTALGGMEVYTAPKWSFSVLTFRRM